MNGVLKIIQLCVEKIKDETLLFSVIAILLAVTFPSERISIFILYLIALIAYAVITSIRLSKHQTDNRFLYNFDQFLKNTTDWERRTIDDSEVYFYTRDNNYKIIQGEASVRDWEPRIEPWMNNFPDAYVSEWRVYLKHGENVIAEYTFMSCDGARYFIPLPKKRCAEPGDNYRCNRFEYIWNRGSVEYKIAEVIGRFYRYENLEEVARFCGITIE